MEKGSLVEGSNHPLRSKIPSLLRLANPDPAAEQDVRKWSYDEVVSWVTTILQEKFGFVQAESWMEIKVIAEGFRTDLIDGDALLKLTQLDWEHLAPVIGMRRRVIGALAKVLSGRDISSARISHADSWTESSSIISSDVTSTANLNTKPPAPTPVAPPNAPMGFLLNLGRATRPAVESPMYEQVVWAEDWAQKSRYTNQLLVDCDYDITEKDVPGLFSRSRLRFIYFFLKRVYLTKTVFGLVTISSLAWTLFILLAVHICMVNKLAIDADATMFLSVLLFPLSFSVNAAYDRKEQALQNLAHLKCATHSLILVFESWSKDNKELPPGYLVVGKRKVMALSTTIRAYIRCADEGKKDYHLAKIHGYVMELNDHIDLLRFASIPPTLLSRPIQMLSDIIHSFEKLRVVADYRTPASTRAFIWHGLHLCTFMLVPVFARLGLTHWKPYGYLSAYTVSELLLRLTRVQEVLELPFGHDQDDVNLDSLRTLSFTNKAFGPSNTSPRLLRGGTGLREMLPPITLTSLSKEEVYKAGVTAPGF
eukprot:NODE_839_length_2046_cov_79.155486_g794_i0.p1 GENE.NODE_839_length_2046_cov_79.155486_g794_i0~~NODE_839_length_2046_cov_79.155486_g794_i0.p1  ORF type:complete len:560 (-),score=72.66 NODE_839_length_2046_cov_79.155486_g794_i0:366-1976(-)